MTYLWSDHFLKMQYKVGDYVGHLGQKDRYFKVTYCNRDPYKGNYYSLQVVKSNSYGEKSGTIYSKQYIEGIPGFGILNIISSGHHLTKIFK